MYLINRLRTLVRDESGQDLIEYALLAALIAIGLIGGAGFLGTRINGLFNQLGNRLPQS